MIMAGQHRIADIQVGNDRIAKVWRDGETLWERPAPLWTGLAFTFEEAGTELKLTKNGSPAAITLQISTDGGVTWPEWKETNGVRSFTSTTAGQKICLKGDNETISTSNNDYYQFSMNGRVAASGNIQSLVGFSDSVSEYCYYCMFEECTSLLTAPELPADTMAIECYAYMFVGCTALVTAPVLPATTLNTMCYCGMFYGCTSLVNAPALPATTLGYGCYIDMFRECISLTSAPVLAASDLVSSCYEGMFYGCTSLVNITMLATYYYAWDYPFRDWVVGVAPTGTFTKAIGMTLPIYGCIPEGWTVKEYEG